jgi:MinD superfamily P-loop ATPase
VPALVCINKIDVNPKRVTEIEAFCAGRDIEVVGRIPFDTVVTEAMVQGQPVTAYTDGPVSFALREVWERLKVYV